MGHKRFAVAISPNTTMMVFYYIDQQPALSAVLHILAIPRVYLEMIQLYQ